MANRFFLMVLTAFLMVACNKEADYITSLPAFENANIIQTDTFSVEASINRPDSIFTGYAEYFKLGCLRDPIFGFILARPVFRFALPSQVETITSNHYFDSLVLTIRPSRSWQGDSTQPLDFSVKRVEEEIESESGNLYSHHRFATNPKPLGEKTKTYRPGSSDSIVIKLDDSFGRQIFEMLRAQNEIVTNNLLFMNWMKGLEISVSAKGIGMMLELPRHDSAIQIRFHYHLDNGRPEEKYFDFAMDAASHYYTALDINRQGTPLAKLDENKEIKVEMADPFLFTHSLTEVNTLVSFPGLKEIPKAGTYFSIIMGNFSVKPVQANFQPFPLPSTLQLYYYTPNALLEGPIKYPSGGEIQNGAFVFDATFGEATSFSFDLTEYATAEIASTYFDTKKIMVKRDGFSGELTRLHAGLPGNKSYKSKLTLTFLTYKH